MFYLSEHLWLADDHRIQAGGNAEDVTNDVVFPKFVEIRTKLGIIREQVVTQESMEVRALIGADSEFHTVASGENDTFAYIRMIQKLAIPEWKLEEATRKLLSHFHGS